jgi:hypothetical protein
MVEVVLRRRRQHAHHFARQLCRRGAGVPEYAEDVQGVGLAQVEPGLALAHDDDVVIGSGFGVGAHDLVVEHQALDVDAWCGRRDE